MANKKSPEILVRETLAKEPVREFVWAYENAAEQLKKGVTLASLRYGEKYSPVLPLDIITANCQLDGGEKVPLIVLYHQIGPVKDHTLPFLWTDGCLDHKSALGLLQKFYGRDVVTPKTETHLLAFVSVEKFLSLSQPTQERLVTTCGWTDEIKFVRENKELFFPSIASWIAFRDGGARDLHNFLQFSKLITKKQADDAVKYYEKLIRRGVVTAEDLERVLNHGLADMVKSGPTHRIDSVERELYLRTVLFEDPKIS